MKKQHTITLSALAMVLVACMHAHADERCGAHTAIEPLLNRGMPGYLAEDFKSLLKPKSKATAKPQTPANSCGEVCAQNCAQGCLKAPEVVAADTQPASAAAVAQVAHTAPVPSIESNADTDGRNRHLLPRNVVVSKKAVPRKQPQTCVLRDQHSNTTVMTLTIPQNIRSEKISSTELDERRKAVESLKRLPEKPIKPRRLLPPPLHQRTAHATAPASTTEPSLHVEHNAKSGATRVEANDVNVQQLLAELSAKVGQPVLAHPGLTATISTSTSGNSVIEVVRTIFEPFHFSVIQGSQGLVVCSPEDSYRSVLAAIQQPAPQTAGTSEQKAHVVELASANLPEKQTTREGAVNRIIAIAQDAFASEEEEYANQILTEGLKRFPRSQELNTMLGESYVLTGKYHEAIIVLERSLKLDPHDANTRKLMATALNAIGQPQLAARYFLQDAAGPTQ